MYGSLTTTVNNQIMNNAAFNAPGATPAELSGGGGGGFGMPSGQSLNMIAGLFNLGASFSQAGSIRDIADQQYQIALGDINRQKNDMASQRLAQFRAMQQSVGANQVSYGSGMAGSKSAARIVASTAAARDIRDYQGRASDAAAIARARNNAAMAKYNSYVSASSTEMAGIGNFLSSLS